jgi:hypothetical protein
MLKTTMFWSGNTSELLLMDTPSTRSKGSDKSLTLTKDIPDSKESKTDVQDSTAVHINEPGSKLAKD